MSLRRGKLSLIQFGIGMATLAAGLALRLIPLELPFGVVKWGGSLLWAAMVYWLIAGLVPRFTVGRTVLPAGVAATLVELVRLVHTPGLDAFRLTLAGRLLLGRVFSLWDIAAYWAGIGVVAWVDDHLRTNVPAD